MNTDLLFENARLQGRVITLEAEVKCLEAVIRSHERVDCVQVKDLNAENARLKAEVERLTADLKRLANAGDIMRDEIANHLVYNKGLKVMNEWHAAKEGKQS